jgi:hypothetical protein
MSLLIKTSPLGWREVHRSPVIKFQQSDDCADGANLATHPIECDLRQLRDVGKKSQIDGQRNLGFHTMFLRVSIDSLRTVEHFEPELEKPVHRGCFERQ